MPDSRQGGRHLRHGPRAASRVRGILGRARSRVRRDRRTRACRRRPLDRASGCRRDHGRLRHAAMDARIAGRGHCDVRTVLGHPRPRRRASPSTSRCRPSTCTPCRTRSTTWRRCSSSQRLRPIVSWNKWQIEGRTRAAVVGAGRLGVLVAQVLRERGADVVVFVRSDRPRASLRRTGHGRRGHRLRGIAGAAVRSGRGCDRRAGGIRLGAGAGADRAERSC